MKKQKTSFVCGQCGAIAKKWMGQCADCGTWDSMTETVLENKLPDKLVGYAAEANSQITKLSEVEFSTEARITTGINELDRALGGGLVAGSVILIGGDPGIGKSTLLLQTTVDINKRHEALYVTGEESLSQVSVRAHRLGLGDTNLKLLAETQIERMIALAEKNRPTVMVVDSIQTIFTESIQSAPGSVSQVRESAAQLVRFAKKIGVVLFIVGHVTKDGALAGPRVLEHMVDTVLYFEGQKDSRFRLIRAIKNRFGAANEIGIFAMTDKGLKGINNPSSIFLSKTEAEVSGSTVMVTWEGSRPLLVEVQALVDETYSGHSKRVSVGIDSNRISMLLAVLSRHAGLATHNLDVYLNVVGGVRITETGADLAVVFAILSSLRRKALDRGLAVFGEIGLGGEIRPVQSGQDRIKEAEKHGFKKVIAPTANVTKESAYNIEVISVTDINQALEYI